jgi:FAD/FMN-containing dehydrogenase
MSEDFIDELRNALDKGAVLSGSDIDARYHHDLAGHPAPKPRAVVRPRTTEDVSALLRLCHREGVPVTTQGGMTGLVRAALPNANEIVLSMERMNSVEEVDVSGGVAIAQAGTPLQKLQERVEQDGLMFPLDLGSRGSCTIGGNISTNAGGNRVIRYGMTRDLILGLEVVTADGTVLKGLRKYIKNNTGIDLKQLFIGSEGILGVVTRAALRVFPAPAERQVALCALPSFGQVTAFLRMARASLGGELTAFEVMWNAYYRLTVERVKGRGRAAADPPSVLRSAGGFRQRPRAYPCRPRETAGDGDGRQSDPRRHALDLACISHRDLAHPRFQRRTWPQLPLHRTDRLRCQSRHRPDGGICGYA